MAYNEYWETDEFEDLVARGLIGLYETKIKRTKKCPKAVRFDDEILNKMRRVGCYFAPGDRLAHFKFEENGDSSATQEIDIINDGLPDNALVSLHPKNFDNVDKDIFLISFFLEKLNSIPRPFASDIGGKAYRLMQISFTDKKTEGHGTIVTVDKFGKLQSCYISENNGVDAIGRPIKVKLKPFAPGKSEGCTDYHSVWSSFCFQISQDRRYLWNVQAQEGIAKSTFGVYPEQIKSLFYARDLPQTDTGRKRPILHWVNAHQRRMKIGTEVDVEKYLRGTHEFVMNGTKFKITNPLKQKL